MSCCHITVARTPVPLGDRPASAQPVCKLEQFQRSDRHRPRPMLESMLVSRRRLQARMSRTNETRVRSVQGQLFDTLVLLQTLVQ